MEGSRAAARSARGAFSPCSTQAENNAQSEGLCVALTLMQSTSSGLQTAPGTHGLQFMVWELLGTAQSFAHEDDI